MRRLALCTLATNLMFAGVGCATSSNYVSYGEPMKMGEFEQVTVGAVLAAPDRYAGKAVLVSGVVSEVCQHKGCWIRLADQVGGEAQFVKFTCPVEGRLIPLDAVGQ